jgi:hypothetical protein
MPSSVRIGPLTRASVAKDVVELERAVTSLAAMARRTGKYSGSAPAITAFTATFSTVYSQNSRYAVGRSRPTTWSGLRLVPASIAATRSSVGSTTGRKSVQWLSRNSWRRFSSVSDSSSRGVVRSNETPFRSSPPRGLVRPSITSCMNGRPLTGSCPST